MNITKMLDYANESDGSDSKVSETNAAVGMMACFSVIGTLGNALALYVFSRMLNSKQHLTSTIFILTLAATDFITSALIIPYTMYMEYSEYQVQFEFVCKFYQFITTTTVPYSAFIMVAIAVDRYICICHPFSQAMTTFRAKVVIISLACFACGMGIITSLCYSVYSRQMTSLAIGNSSGQVAVSVSNLSVLTNQTCDVLIPLKNDRGYSINDITNMQKLEEHSAKSPRKELVFKGTCDRSDSVIDNSFQKGFQWFSSSLFLIVLVIVSILYALIYRRVLQRRKAHPHIFSDYWCFCIPKPGIERNQGTINENGFEQNNEKRSLRSPSIRSPSARADKVFLANLKIAVTLFIVTVVFIAAYLPAWLMALKVIPENVVVFYTYFTHNIVNPLIYAFMNQKFRQHLREIRKCPSQNHIT